MIRKTWAGTFAAAALAVTATTALAQDKKVRLQLTGAFPSSTGLLGPTQLHVVERIKTLSNGTIDVKFFEPGSLVPPGQYLDAVGNGSVDAAWTTAGYWTGKDIAFAMFSAVPFGPQAGEYLAWMRNGGGTKLMEELHSKYGIGQVLTCGMIPPEASGWFRKEIKSVEDLKGLKMRFFGLGANVMQKLGVSTQLLQAGEIFQALQLGTIDATEFSMPVMDLTLGFYQVAKHYYFPGWHQQSTMNQLLISKQKWAELSNWQKEVVKTACNDTLLWQFVEGEAIQGPALDELKKKGVTVHQWPKEFLAAYEKAWNEVVKEQAEKSPEFKKVYASYSDFRAKYKLWKDVGYLRD
jgi:TRAP-type mannitol/chloroaromatic compound transport system substrate-binding protein